MSRFVIVSRSKLLYYFLGSFFGALFVYTKWSELKPARQYVQVRKARVSTMLDFEFSMDNESFIEGLMFVSDKSNYCRPTCPYGRCPGWTNEFSNDDEKIHEKFADNQKNRADDFQVIENGTAFAYSAYVDDRSTARDVTEKVIPILRVFTYYDRTLNPKENWRCVLWYGGGDIRDGQGIVVPVYEVTQTNLNSYRFLTAMILCRLPSAVGLTTIDSTPCSVSIVTESYLTNLRNPPSSSDHGNGSSGQNTSTPSDRQSQTTPLYRKFHSCSNNCAKNCKETVIWTSSVSPSNVIRVIDLRTTRRQRWSRDRLGHHNAGTRVMESKDGYGAVLPPVNFTICVGAPLFGRKFKAIDVIRFIEINRILGAQKFIFYLSPHQDESLRGVLEGYTTGAVGNHRPKDEYNTKRRGTSNDSDPLVEVYPWNPPILEGFYYHGQMVALTECLYRVMYRTRYLISQDLDELIVPLRASSWSGMISQLRPPLAGMDAVASYNFLNAFFPLSGSEGRDDPVLVNDSVVLKFEIRELLKTSCDVARYSHGDRSKVMVRPELVIIIHVHFIKNENLIDRKAGVNMDISSDDALLFHFREQTVKNTTRNRRLHVFSEDIKKNVQTAVEQFVMLVAKREYL